MEKKTDNSYLYEKIRLRMDNLPPEDPVRILDVYHGSGRIWDEVIRRTGRDIRVLGIEKKPGGSAAVLRGDNRKYALDYGVFDAVDLDAYGVPFEHLEKLFRGVRRQTIIYVTFIQSQFGKLPVGMLDRLGYPRAMVQKVPSLFNKNGLEKFLQYLALRGVREVKIYHTENKRKNYLCFRIGQDPATPKNGL